jgi:hypothetical protein
MKNIIVVFCNFVKAPKSGTEHVKKNKKNNAGCGSIHLSSLHTQFFDVHGQGTTVNEKSYQLGTPFSIHVSVVGCPPCYRYEGRF